MRVDYVLLRVALEEGEMFAGLYGRAATIPLYWWVGPDGTRYYTPPLRGRRVGVDRDSGVENQKVARVLEYKRDREGLRVGRKRVLQPRR